VCGMEPFETKIDALRRLMAAEDWVGAMRMATRFPRLGEHKRAITRAWDALQSPSLYRQMGAEPEDVWKAGVEALKARYLPAPAERS